MANVDYIVVGLGIAGISFCEQLRVNKKTFVVFEDDSQVSSEVAGGVYNPVILKRCTLAWKAKEQLSLANAFYQNLQDFLKVKIDYPLSIYRKFHSAEEQNDWTVASDQPNLENFLSSKLISSNNDSLTAPLGFGKVQGTGMIDTWKMISSYRSYLLENNKLIDASFIYDQVKTESRQLSYQDYNTKYIVFAEGYGISKNPYFKNLPLNGTKGEVLIIKAADLKLNFILKSSVFIIPIGNDKYYVGATYEHRDKTFDITEEAKDELLRKLKDTIKCKFEIIEQKAGIRPTTSDRKPLVGTHHQYKNLCVLNGLGTRGVMIGPYISKELFNHLEEGTELDPEIDISRFIKN